jgi:hypothetical protein
VHHPDRVYGHRGWVVGEGKLVSVAKTGRRLDLLTITFIGAVTTAIILIWIFVP